MPAGYYIRKTRKAPRHVRQPDQDWPGIINALLCARFPKLQICAYTGMSREKIYSALAGRYEPTWSEGNALLALLMYADQETA